MAENWQIGRDRTDLAEQKMRDFGLKGDFPSGRSRKMEFKRTE